MRRVIIASPYSAANGRSRHQNVKYAWDCMLDCFAHGEAPFASHLIYTQILDDAKEEDRKLGIEAGHSWILKAEALVVYDNFGISEGMKSDIIMAQAAGVPIEFRQLPDENL